MIASVVTTRNEAATIGPLCSWLADYGPVFVIDAGSSDDTVLRARRSGAMTSVVPGAPIGPALRLGWKQALQVGAERVIQIDAGGSHDPCEAPDLLRVHADIVIGSRFMGASCYEGRPWRRFASRSMARLCNTVGSDLQLSDWTSGYRLFTAGALEHLIGLPYRAQMHGWQIEVLIAAAKQGMTVAEVPISYIAGESSFSWPVAREALGVVVRG